VGIRFGEFVLETESRELLRAGREVRLGPKAFELLEFLVSRRPRALSKFQIRDRLWPRTTVSESTLASVVSELRSALGDEARRPRFVRTVYGFGYAFCGEASEAGRAVAAAGTDGARFGIVWHAREIGLPDGETIIGRGSDCGVRIDQPDVSRHHARIRIEEDAASIEDLGSKNGTCVSGKAVQGLTSLWDGAEIIVGSEPLLFRVCGASRSTRTGKRRG